MVLITDHIITVYLVDVIVYIYNTLEKICEALAANWSCTCVMVKNDFNPPRWTNGAPTQTQTVTDQGVNVSGVCKVINES